MPTSTFCIHLKKRTECDNPVCNPSACKDCNTNPALNDGSLGIEWIKGGVTKNHPCGCTIEGRGYCNYPLHIHFCETHKAQEILIANVRLLVKWYESPEERSKMEERAQIATDGNVTALQAIVEQLKVYLPVEGR
jgi:hypothetical protein